MILQKKTFVCVLVSHSMESNELLSCTFSKSLSRKVQATFLDQSRHRHMRAHQCHLRRLLSNFVTVQLTDLSQATQVTMLFLSINYKARQSCNSCNQLQCQVMELLIYMHMPKMFARASGWPDWTLSVQSEQLSSLSAEYGLIAGELVIDGRTNG